MSAVRLAIVTRPQIVTPQPTGARAPRFPHRRPCARALLFPGARAPMTLTACPGPPRWFRGSSARGGRARGRMVAAGSHSVACARPASCRAQGAWPGRCLRGRWAGHCASEAHARERAHHDAAGHWRWRMPAWPVGRLRALGAVIAREGMRGGAREKQPVAAAGPSCRRPPPWERQRSREGGRCRKGRGRREGFLPAQMPVTERLLLRVRARAFPLRVRVRGTGTGQRLRFLCFRRRQIVG